MLYDLYICVLYENGIKNLYAVTVYSYENPYTPTKHDYLPEVNQIQKKGTPKECPKQQNCKCYRFDLIEPVHGL